jgi:hypothetical protein
VSDHAARGGCAGVLIAYWRTFGEMNNHEYFSRGPRGA